ncbi:MAG: enoyl-CoA hydratase [Vulcanimicrobiaceae bacterium]
MSDDILLSAANGIATVCIHRPNKKNALTGAMYDAMTQALAAADRDESVRVVLLRGGEDFTAGNDLLDFMSADGGDFSDSPSLQFLFALHRFQKPIVCAVSGVAIGIGTTMLMHADLVVAAETATFSLPFVKIALVPEAAATLLLPHAIGMARAKRFLMTGETFGARTAYEMGLIAEVVADGDVFRVAQERAATLAALPAEALAQTKRLLRAPLRERVEQTMMAEAGVFAACLKSVEFRTAAARFTQGKQGRGPLP